MRRFLLITFIVATAIFNKAIAQEKKDTLPAFFGASYIPSVNWSVNFINHKDIGKPLTLNFDLTSMSTYEGNVGIRRIGLRMGISAQMENNLIGKVYRWGGYLGFRNMMLRLQSSKISGNYVWSGAIPALPAYSRTGVFSNSYTNIDIIKVGKKKRYIDGKWVVMPGENIMGWYWGVGYTSFAHPIEISTLITDSDINHAKFGVPAYDPKYNIKTYNISFGFDLLRYLCLTGGRYGLNPGMPANRFAMYTSLQDKIGFGSGRVSNYGVSMAEILNPGREILTDKFFNVIVSGNISLGFRYYFRTGPAAYIFALGYDFEGAMMAPFSGAIKDNKDIGMEFLNFYFNHGVSFKFYISFNRDWK